MSVMLCAFLCRDPLTSFLVGPQIPGDSVIASSVHIHGRPSDPHLKDMSGSIVVAGYRSFLKEPDVRNAQDLSGRLP